MGKIRKNVSLIIFDAGNFSASKEALHNAEKSLALNSRILS